VIANMRPADLYASRAGPWLRVNARPGKTHPTYRVHHGPVVHLSARGNAFYNPASGWATCPEH